MSGQPRGGVLRTPPPFIIYGIRLDRSTACSKLIVKAEPNTSQCHCFNRPTYRSSVAPVSVPYGALQVTSTQPLSDSRQQHTTFFSGRTEVGLDIQVFCATENLRYYYTLRMQAFLLEMPSGLGEGKRGPPRRVKRLSVREQATTTASQLSARHQ
jgi:hypothetical protein